MDCGQTLVSYTDEVWLAQYDTVVDCGQTLVSYARGVSRKLRMNVVDCGQTLVSYTTENPPAPLLELWIADRPW